MCALPRQPPLSFLPLMGESAGICKCEGELRSLETTTSALESTPSFSWLGFFASLLFFINFKEKYCATLLVFLLAPPSHSFPKTTAGRIFQKCSAPQANMHTQMGAPALCSQKAHFTGFPWSSCSLCCHIATPQASLTSSAISRCHLFKRRKKKKS